MAACRDAGVKTIAVTADYVDPEPRAEFFAAMDAANIDLKAFTERFYHKICGGHLAPVLETLEYVKHETDTWLELTTLLIPGENDSDAELEAMTAWVVEKLGPDVPMHFTAFHPDWKMPSRICSGSDLAIKPESSFFCVRFGMFRCPSVLATNRCIDTCHKLAVEQTGSFCGDTFI